MDKTKILVALLAISLCGNIFLLAGGGNNPTTEGISQFILYAYHQAFPPIEKRDHPTGWEWKQLDREQCHGNWPSGWCKRVHHPRYTLHARREWSADETLLQMLLSLENETPSAERQYEEPEVTPTPDQNAWKTYESSKWHFSIPYPPSWTVKEGTSASPAVTFTAPIETSMQCRN